MNLELKKTTDDIYIYIYNYNIKYLFHGISFPILYQRLHS